MARLVTFTTPLQRQQFTATLQTIIGVSALTEEARRALSVGFARLTVSQLVQLLIVIRRQPAIVSVLAEKVLAKRTALTAPERDVWLHLVAGEERELASTFLRILEEESRRSDQERIDKIRKSL